MDEQKPKPRGFSGKSALIKNKREERLAVINSTRCPVCEVPLTDDVKIMWCRVSNCPKTQKRAPTSEDTDRVNRG